jgi:signal peptidase I
MEPELKSGALLMIESINPEDIQVGDIIVYTVPPMVREYYNYPPTIAHRVIQVNTVPSLSFRTKGDNTGEDPFTVRPEDIKGTVGKQIPYLGLPLLFFQSQQGLIFAIVAIVLLALFLYGNELLQGGGWLHRRVFSPVIDEEKRANRLLARKMEATEKKVDATEQALVQFSAAVSEYAKHLASHTSAIQNLAEASQELKKGAAEQNKVLATIMENMIKKQETIDIKPEVTPPASIEVDSKEVYPVHEMPDLTGQVPPPGCARGHYQKLSPQEILEKWKSRVNQI